MTKHVRRGISICPDPARAAKELATQLDPAGADFSVVFASSAFDTAQVVSELKKNFSTPVFGCTTAGEIGPAGYASGSITGFSFRASEAQACPIVIENLSTLTPERIGEIALKMEDHVAWARRSLSPAAQAFGIVLIDGLSKMEERLVGSLSPLAPSVNLLGGSAGDDLKFKSSSLFCDGKVLNDAALIIVVATTLPFKVFKTQHFEPRDLRLVTTSADVEQRIVHEFDGEPAADVYARAVGCRRDQLGPEVFSRNPVMIALGGEYYVRSIQEALPDGSLRFYCAIEEGLVLALGQGTDLPSNLEKALKDATCDIQDPALVLCFECILRRLEVVGSALESAVGEVYGRYNTVGFHTYGEQLGAVHINQTLTGLVIGDSADT